MNVAHGIRPAEVQKIIVAAHLAVPGVEARAAIAFLVELESLDHCAHSAVEHEDPLAQQIQKCSSGTGLGRAHKMAPDQLTGCTAGRRPSRWQIANTRSARFIV